MSLTLRRFLVLFAFLFWQGGFLFYGAVVVPVGRATLDPPSLQSQVTMPVTRYLNYAGKVALALLALDVFLTRDASARRRRLRWLSWLSMMVAMAGLMGLHPRLSDMMGNSDHPQFYPLHRAYLLTSALQSFLAMLFLVLTLRAWQSEDRVTMTNDQ